MSVALFSCWEQSDNAVQHAPSAASSSSKKACRAPQCRNRTVAANENNIPPTRQHQHNVHENASPPHGTAKKRLPHAIQRIHRRQV
jgi:hypothetical protein